MDRDRALQLAAKLLNMDATKGCTPEEAANAAERLSKIMEEHQLDMLTVQAELHRTNVAQETQETAWARMPTWATFIVPKIIRAFGCFPLLAWGVGSKVEIRVIGEATEAALCRYFLGYLLDQLPRAFAAFARTTVGQAHVLFAGSRDAARTAWLVGAGETVAGRLARMHTEWTGKLAPEQQEGVRGLVVVRDAAIKRWVEDTYPERRQSNKRTVKLDPHAYRAGVQHGEAMALSTGLRGTTPTGRHLTGGTP